MSQLNREDMVGQIHGTVYIFVASFIPGWDHTRTSRAPNALAALCIRLVISKSIELSDDITHPK